MSKFFRSPLFSITVDMKCKIFTFQGSCAKTINLGDSPCTATDVAEDVLARKALLPSELPCILPQSELALVGNVYMQLHRDVYQRRHFSTPINLQITRDQVRLVASALTQGLGGGIAPVLPRGAQNHHVTDRNVGR